MEKYIVWLIPDNKKIQLRSFHTEAGSIKEAISNLEKNATFTYKVIGVSGYKNLGSFANKEEEDNNFINNSFH